MRRSGLKLIGLLLSCLISLSVLAQSPISIPFSFKLSDQARTSAGVFSKDSTLLRTLWSGVSYPAGTHQQTWDGLDDEGRLVPKGAYDIRVLSNKVTYTWEGVIGNSSAGVSKGNALQRGFLRTFSMAITGNTAYYGVGYAEGNPSQAKFSLTNPQARIEFSPKGETAQATTFVATDGKTVYWAGYDGYDNGNTWFVFGTNVSDDKEKQFPNGASRKMALGKVYSSCIDVINDQTGTITGLAVQKKGNYLFVSHKARHQIRVFNKTTGAQVQALFFNDAGPLAVDEHDNLWVINGTTVKKFTVQPNGNLSPASLELSGLRNPMAIAVSPDDKTVLVADGGNSQQLKAYSNSTGAADWTFGRAGGYKNDPVVTDDKFYFSDSSQVINDTFIAFEPDGSFWIGDSGNYRIQHYSASRGFVERVQYLQNSYSSAVDSNNPRRVFCQYLEFDVDYTKPLTSSWTLVKNWRASIPKDYFAELSINHTFITDVFKSVTTLTNGRTYGFLKQPASSKWVLVELPATGPVRFTGLQFNDAPYYIAPDGSFNQAISQPSGPGGSVRWQKQLLTGFDAKNNPVWAAPALVARIPSIDAMDPVDFTGYGSMRPGLSTASGVIVSFNKNKQINENANRNAFHLGGIKPGSTKWAWKTARATTAAYTGGFPADGAYDIGNSVEYGGGDVTVSGRHIFWSYHGEFWKNSQTNKWNHVYDNGLFIGQFGVLGTETGGQTAFPGMGGNVLYGTAVAGPDGAIYIWHAEESGHSGVHRWKVDGLNTIREQSIPVTIPETSARGLLGMYVTGSQLNNANFRKTQVDRIIDAGQSNASFTTANSTESSVRWTGFVTPRFSERHAFYVAAEKGVRLWVDNQLLVDQATANKSAEYVGSVALETGKQYAIRLECFGSSRASLSWSSNSQPKQIIDSQYLQPAKEPAAGSGIDLLDGLTPGSILANKLYGWERNPVQEDYTDPNSKYWTAKTKVKTYAPTGSPDLYICFRQDKATYSVTRQLGDSTNAATGWRLTGSINQDGNFFSIDEGKNKNGGSYIEVLDDGGKVLTRVNCQVTLSPSPIGRIYGNNKLIAQGDYHNTILPVFNSSQPIDIVMMNGSATIKYGPYAAVSASPVDLTGNWKKPRTLRLYFWGNGYNMNRVIDIERMQFFTKENSASVLLSANDEQNTLEAKNPLGNATILVSEAGGPFVPYTDVINVGDTERPEGYWQFKLESSTPTPDSDVVTSPAFTADGDDKLTVYPNPTQGILTVQHPTVSGDCLIELLAIDGKQLTNWIPATGTTSTTVDVTHLPKGVYVIQFKKDKSKLATRFIR